ncbi:hypothetical protein FJ434_11775 [Mesorhizobium sp. B2-5-13]|uniref:hypothetical protein n=1 Tax=unclassified Mesorhizobium TaxID=325217 RepID=UPI001128BF95|nr:MULTISPECIES: hypothetical protein [unclassified Mesorhizobium]TPJ88148.1 hypothetical protein FJ434_11775 [Mesorhizobium sp. B2-5-13]TPK52343.1 hypothetical protein FJ560_07190 [Mesorhizobium sp. B2-5-5]
MLYMDESHQPELNTNLVSDRPEIEKTVRRVCKLLNKLSQDGAIYAHGWVGAELINSPVGDEERAIELSRIIQRQIEKELRSVHSAKGSSTN